MIVFAEILKKDNDDLIFWSGPQKGCGYRRLWIVTSEGRVISFKGMDVEGVVKIKSRKLEVWDRYYEIEYLLHITGTPVLLEYPKDGGVWEMCRSWDEGYLGFQEVVNQKVNKNDWERLIRREFKFNAKEWDKKDKTTWSLLEGNEGYGGESESDYESEPNWGRRKGGGLRVSKGMKKLLQDQGDTPLTHHVLKRIWKE